MPSTKSKSKKKTFNLAAYAKARVIKGKDCKKCDNSGWDDGNPCTCFRGTQRIMQMRQGI